MLISLNNIYSQCLLATNAIERHINFHVWDETVITIEYDLSNKLLSIYYICLLINRIVRWHRSLFAPWKRRMGRKAMVHVHTEGPDGMSAPQVATFNWTEVAVPQIKRCAVLSVARNIGRITRVPPWVPGERTDGRHR